MKPKIHFVHQKVDASDPEESNREARLKITNSMDQNARDQAQFLKTSTPVTKLNDVINTEL